jgi:hypothetical protein
MGELPSRARVVIVGGGVIGCVRGDQREWPARLQIAPFYDPQRLRILTGLSGSPSSSRDACLHPLGKTV